MSECEGQLDLFGEIEAAKQLMSDRAPCWELEASKRLKREHPKWPWFCASNANGHGRCRKGLCHLVDGDRAEPKGGWK